ncbi:MAG TPA: cupredoxin family protein [Pseudomonadales bacterium]|nr:cupredoxin family protein [Pseudomonadales bacterium]
MTTKHTVNAVFMSLIIGACSSLTWADGSGHSHHDNMNAGAMAEESNFGKPGIASKVTRTIEVSMGNDMRFTPNLIQIKQGETIRFILKNTGSTPHEMVLGTADEIREHAEMMKKMPNMKHNEPSMASVEPGKTGEIIWNFDLEGEFQFACLIPGHLEAGMTGNITVSPSK